jgi:hypothetical protein
MMTLHTLVVTGLSGGAGKRETSTKSRSIRGHLGTDRR